MAFAVDVVQEVVRAFIPKNPLRQLLFRFVLRHHPPSPAAPKPHDTNMRNRWAVRQWEDAPTVEERVWGSTSGLQRRGVSGEVRARALVFSLLVGQMADSCAE